MPKIADALERESRSVDLEHGDFERLLDRRERKQRNRRIRAGAVLSSWRSRRRRSSPATSPGSASRRPRRSRWGPARSSPGARTLGAREPDSGETRTIVDAEALPFVPGEYISSAAWSPDRQWVAFRRGPGSQAGELWVADTVGGAPRQVATDVGWSPWVWSPTGDQLVFVLGRDVTLIDAMTGRETDLGTTVSAKDSEGYAVHALAWSSDGSRIAYDGPEGSVYSIDVESGEHTLLVDRPAGMASVEDLDWSPDGTHVAITYGDVSQGDSKALYVANAEGSDLRLVARIDAGLWPVWHPGLSVGSAWSPDGTRLAYLSRSGPKGDRELQLWTVSANGSDLSLVTSRCCVSGGDPVWSPDGSQIAFSTEGEGGVQLGAIVTDQVVVNADGTGDQQAIDHFTYRSWAGGWYFCFCYG